MKKVFIFLLLSTILVSITFAQYCTPAYTIGTTSSDFLNGVQLNTISNLNSGGTGVPSYTDYTAVYSTNLNQNTAYSLFTYNCPGWTETVAGWIDYNQNGVFDATEKLGEVTMAPGAMGTINFTVPAGAQPGYTRLRVRLAYATSNVDPCANYTFGETEDYEILIGTPSPDDIGVANILNLNSGCGLSAATPITVEIFNYGTNPQTNPMVYMQVDGGLVYAEQVFATIASLNNTIYTFTATANLATPGLHTVKAWTAMPGDGFTPNDTSIRNVTTIVTVNTYPYFDNFDTGPLYWTSGGTNNSFQMGTPTSPVISGPYSSPNCWKTKLNGSCNNSEQSWVEGPCFDFSSLNAPVMEMAVWWYSEPNYDGAIVMSSIDNGATWQRVGNYLDPVNWYNATNLIGAPGTLAANPTRDGWAGTTAGSGGWLIAKHDLTGLQNQPNVKLRIAFASDPSVTYDGFAFDNVKIYDKPPFDLGVSAKITPVSNFCTAPLTNFDFAVSNFGSQTQNNVDCYMEVIDPLGGFNSYYSTVASVPVNGSATVTFNNIPTNVGGTYKIKAYTSSLLDFDAGNDTLSFWVNVAQTPDEPISNSPIFCTPDSATLTVSNALPGAVYSWFSDPTLTNFITSGLSYTTPVITTTTSFFVTGQSYLQHNVGRKSKQGGNGISTTVPGTNGLSFNVANPCIIDSITLYPAGAGTVTIYVNSPTGTIVGQVTQSHPAPSVAGGPVRIPLGIAINTPGNGYIMRCNSTSSSLFYNTTGSTYPYIDPSNTVSITSTSTGNTNIYYFFYEWTISMLGCTSPVGNPTVTISIPPQPALGPDAITCSGYVIDGTTPTAVAYSWSTGQTNPVITANSSNNYILYAYNVYGCVGMDSVTVQVLATPTVNLGPDINNCQMSAPLDAGTQPAGSTFNWNSAANFATTQNVTANQSGTYIVTVTNPSGCTKSDTINVVLNGVSVDLGADIVSCNSAVNLNAGNFGPNATYLWSTGSTASAINVTQSGNYSVIVTNGNCTSTDNINVSFSTAPVVNLGPDQTVCGGTTLDAGNPGAIYSWSSGQTTQTVNVTQSGTYAVYLNFAGGCVSSGLVNVTVHQVPVANFVVQSSNPSTGYYQFNANGTTGTLPLTYNWSFGDGTFSNVQNASHTYNQPGVYTVMLVVSNQVCGNDTMIMEVISTVNGLEDAGSIKDLQVFPNPTSSMFTVASASLNTQNLTISLLDIQGKELFSDFVGSVNGLNRSYSVAELAKGVYMLRLSDGETQTFRKLVIE